MQRSNWKRDGLSIRRGLLCVLLIGIKLAWAHYDGPLRRWINPDLREKSWMDEVVDIPFSVRVDHRFTRRATFYSLPERENPEGGMTAKDLAEMTRVKASIERFPFGVALSRKVFQGFLIMADAAVASVATSDSEVGIHR